MKPGFRRSSSRSIRPSWSILVWQLGAFLQIAAQLMTRDPHMVEFLEHNSPIIKNDLLLLFGNKQPEEVSTNEGREALRTAALEAVRKIIAAEGQKPEALEGVYFTSFVMQ